MTSSYDEREALRLMAAGDQRGFTAIYDRYFGGVFRVARKFLKSDDLAMDIVQDVFLVLLEKKNFTSVEQFQFYLHVAARNKCMDYIERSASIKKASREYALIVGKVDSSQERSEFLRELEKMERLLNKAIENLPQTYRQAVIMRKLEGRSYEAIGKKLNIPESKVQGVLKKAVRHITKELQHNLTSLFFAVLAFI